MPLDLPAPIALYVAADNDGDAAALARCFAPDAIVHDEGRHIAGLAAIAAWKTAAKAKYRHRLQPLRIRQDGARATLTCRVAGNFPGSPVELDFGFTLADGLITALEIA